MRGLRLITTFVFMHRLFFKKHIFLLLILLVNFCPVSFSNKWEDSVLRALPGLNDTSLVIAFNKLSDFYSDNNYDKSKWYAHKAISKADSIGFNKGRMDGRDNLGLVFIQSAEYSNAVNVYKEAINIAQQAKFLKKLPWLYNRLSAAYYYQGNYENALMYYIKTSELAKKINNKSTLLVAYNGIANIYMAKVDYINAGNYYSQGLVIAHDLNDTNSVALIENNLGLLYFKQDNFKKAMPHYDAALKIYKSYKDSSNIALTLINIGLCNGSTENYSDALRFYNEALEIYLHRNDNAGLAICYTDMATIYNRKNDYPSAIDYLKRALKIATKIGRKEIIKKCYDSLSDIYNKTGQYQLAYDYSKKLSDIKDSLFNETNTRSMNELQTKYETEKKESEIGRLSLQNEAQNARNRQQTTLTYFFITAFLLVLVIVFVVYRQYKITRATNREIKNQKLIVEIQNKEITDSINYARQIQQAILPASALIDQFLQNYFILYKPKAIVSGDFYFYSETESRILLAVVDCTGHGVPGAFMSMIGHNLLTQIINEKGLRQPGEILNQLHKGVRNALHQDSEKSENRDGMDIALISLDKDFSKLEYAGANRPLYLIRDGELKDTKGDKFPIGGLQYEKERKFSNHVIDLLSGDTLYLCSDGYADQFGGEKGKKFMVKNLQRTLVEIQPIPMREQKIRLDAVLESWKRGHEQIDDILVIGLRV
jgi:serine phosphatase RsbU (regulator of sigma subunit)/Tfp pilus assembly protein PilF